jgi:RNA polymerase sigma-70 factor (ECF subfamily)
LTRSGKKGAGRGAHRRYKKNSTFIFALNPITITFGLCLGTGGNLKSQLTGLSNKEVHNSNEQDLLARIAAGDTAAFDTLFRLHWDHVYSVAFLASRSADFAKDVAQEVFLWVWKERQQITAVENIRAYLYGATRNFILRKLKRATVEENYKRSLVHPGAYIMQAQATPEMNARLKELQQLIEAGIRKLPPQQQRAFRLSREQGLSHEAIAREMGLSGHTVKDYIVKALAFLRKYIAQYGDILMVCLFAGYVKIFF